MLNLREPCLECGEMVVGRSDKKFCSDLCRTRFHNRCETDLKNMMLRVNNTLKRNRRILKSMNPKGTIKVEKEKLLQKGFNFDYVTSVYTNKANNQYRYCYDQGYLELNESLVLLVSREL